MKILHCCFAAFYIDDYSYQENVLPKIHKMQGHEVAILASVETYVNQTEISYLKPDSYHTKEGIPITRLPYTKLFPFFLAKKLRIYKGILKKLEAFKPDILFLHDLQFLSIIDIVLYAKKYKTVKIYVDCHTDFINSAKNWLSRNLLHRIIYKWCARQIEPYTRKFYGVLPLRCEFLNQVYGISKNKIELLPLGAEHTVADIGQKENIRSTVRNRLQLHDNDFVLITGGKIDLRKNIHILIKAVIELELSDLKLVVFGSPNLQMKKEIDKLTDNFCIRYTGWLPSEKIYNLLLASDLGVFPGTHSVLWEQAVGVGLPCVFKRWKGIEHVDVGGNCLFIENSDLKEIKEKILLLYQNREILMNLKQVAMEKGMTAFSYYEIAKKAIEG